MNLKNAQDDVKTFMTLANQTVSESFTELSKEEAALRADLIHEEVVLELLPVLEEIRVGTDSENGMSAEGRDRLYERLMDAVVDSFYVILGIPVALGVTAQKYFDEAHRSNMTKFVEGLDGNLYPIRNKVGKAMKPKSFDPPKFLEMIQNDQKPEWRQK